MVIDKEFFKIIYLCFKGKNYINMLKFYENKVGFFKSKIKLMILYYMFFVLF